jgi:hypothetical protein
MKAAITDLVIALVLYAAFGAIVLLVAIVVTDALFGSVLP